MHSYLTKFMLLRRNTRCTVICVIKTKYEINKIYVIKAKYMILVIANLLLFLYAQLLCFITFLYFLDAAIYFEIKRCQCLVFSYSENINEMF